MKRELPKSRLSTQSFDQLVREAGDALAAVSTRYELNSRQTAQLATVAAALASDARAPTTVHLLADVIDVHLADSLVALEVAAVRGASRAADLGAGAGFPGTALAIALPSCSMSLVESQSRKAAHLRRLLDLAAIENASVVERRAEEWPDGLRAHDLLTARALAPSAVVVEYAAPLLEIGGTLVDWRGRRDREQERVAAAAAAELGLDLVEIRHVQPYADAVAHHLHVYVKHSPTPERFPRRPGVARKRPLAR